MTGLVIGAERKLQRYEFKQRYLHNEERMRATMDLARSGSVGSEEEITRLVVQDHIGWYRVASARNDHHQLDRRGHRS